jgi:hypothetical protein
MLRRNLVLDLSIALGTSNYPRPSVELDQLRIVFGKEEEQSEGADNSRDVVGGERLG